MRSTYRTYRRFFSLLFLILIIIYFGWSFSLRFSLLIAYNLQSVEVGGVHSCKLCADCCRHRHGRRRRRRRSRHRRATHIICSTIFYFNCPNFMFGSYDMPRYISTVFFFFSVCVSFRLFCRLAFVCFRCFYDAL